MADYLSPASFLNPLTPLAMELEGARLIAEKAQAIANRAREIQANAAYEATREGIKGALQVGNPDPLGRYGLFGMAIDSGVDTVLPPNGMPGGEGGGGLFGGLGKLSDNVNKLANKALIGELIVVGGVVAVAGIAAWYFSKKEDAPSLGTLLRLVGKG